MIQIYYRIIFITLLFKVIKIQCEGNRAAADDSAAAFAADAADVVWSEVTESPETEGNIVLTIRPAGLLLPDEGVIALFVTGLAELIAGDEDGESFQLDPLP